MKRTIYMASITAVCVLMLSSATYIVIKPKQAVIAPATFAQPIKDMSTVTVKLDELALLINKDRADVGLPPFTRNAALDASATNKCNDMVAGKYWGHVNAAGKHGYEYIPKKVGMYAVGENLSYGYIDAPTVNKGWVTSPKHYAAIVSTVYTNVGYALCDVAPENSKYTNTVVQHFSN